VWQADICTNAQNNSEEIFPEPISIFRKIHEIILTRFRQLYPPFSVYAEPSIGTYEVHRSQGGILILLTFNSPK